MTRLEKTFSLLKKAQKKAFVAFINSGDPDLLTSQQILENLPKNGVDIIEIGMAFSDPAADGPVIEAASKRAIAAGITLAKTLQMLKTFRKINQTTPVILMGYYNPIFHYGLEKFAIDAAESGADGILIVDLPCEEDGEFAQFTAENNLALIKLIAPNSSEKRIKKIIDHSRGFVYLVSVFGITGTKAPDIKTNAAQIARIRNFTNLPIIIGFGIKDFALAKKVAKLNIDGIVIGSALVSVIEQGLKNNLNREKIIQELLSQTAQFQTAINY